MLKTASPGVERGVDVRVRLAGGMFGEGVVTGRRNFDVAYPVAGCFDTRTGDPTP